MMAKTVFLNRSLLNFLGAKMMYRLFATGMLLAAGLLGAANAAAQDGRDDTLELMTNAANAFLASLTVEQRAITVFDFDADVRQDWHFIPKRDRKGLKLTDMAEDQRQLAHTLLSSGLSRSGYAKTTMVMSLEFLVRARDVREGNLRNVDIRNPGYYHVSIFGAPSMKETWGWGLEGHHVSVNFTIVDGKILSSAPLFLGANPNEVLVGPRKGLRVLGAEEDFARELLGALDGGQKKQAILGDKAPRDIFSKADRMVTVKGKLEGLPLSKMNAKQGRILHALIDEYISYVPEESGAHRRRLVKDAGDEIYFAWMGAAEKRQGDAYYFRVQASTFLIEFDNIQNNANHSHSVWRDIAGDFGADILAEHHRRDHK